MTNGTLVSGRYEIVETIGKGGMAIVYKAKCLVLNRYVALKVLRPEFREDKEFLNRFKVEAQSAASLSHNNVVSIFDVVQEGDLDYIVMEYVEGVTLKQYLEAKGVIPWREAVDYAAQICAGLDHAHKKGIVHKDIKPHNILITREGTLKITDFGIAKVMSSSTITSGGATMGSVHYFSPEQARGGYMDAKTDIYSLGVVLYEMVTGKLPFQGDSAISIAMQHIEKTPEAPTALNPDVPQSLENVISRAMCKDQILRYDSVMQMMVDLRKVYTGAEVDYSDLTREVAGRVSGREKPPVIPPELLNDDEPRKKPSKTGKSKKKEVLSVFAGIVAGLALIAALFFAGYYFTSGKTEQVQVPDFVNKTMTEAESLITNSELTLVIEKEEKSNTVAIGKIISQSPAAGKMVDENAEIKVVISLGEGEFPMPDVVNRKYTEAEEILKNKKLQYSIVEEPSDTMPAEYVVRQVPEAGTFIDSATSVTVYVSTGKEETMAEVPKLVGLTVSEAKSTLLDAGLTWGQIVEVGSTKPKGTVIAQSITPGIGVAEQTAIDLRVSSGQTATAAPSASPAPSAEPTQSPKPSSPGIVIGPPNAGGN